MPLIPPTNPRRVRGMECVMFLFLAAACGGLSSGAAPEAEEEVTVDETKVSLNFENLDGDDIKPDGTLDVIMDIDYARVPDQSLINAPYMCVALSTVGALYDGGMSLVGSGLGGSDDWLKKGAEAVDVYINGNYIGVCSRTWPNEDRFRANFKSNSSDCDSETDPDFGSERCWADIDTQGSSDRLYTVDSADRGSICWQTVLREADDGTLYYAIVQDASACRATGE